MTSVDEKIVGVKAITVKPIIRQGWLPKGHDGEYRFTGTEVGFQPEMDTSTRQLKTGLTEEDERRLEKEMHLPVGTLNKYNKDFWGTKLFKIPKEGKTYFLDNPSDELEYKVLSKWSKIAPSKIAIADCPDAMFYLSNVEDEAKLENVKANNEMRAAKLFGQLSQTEMVNVLKIYTQLEGKSTGKVSKDTSLDVISATLYKKLKADPTEFLRIKEDPSFNTRVSIDDFISNRVLTKSGAKYLITGGDVIGHTLEQTIDYLSDPRNQDTLLTLNQKLAAINK